MRWKERDLPDHASQRRALWDWVEEWTGHPALVGFLARLIRICNIPARDDISLARAVQLFAQHKVKYFKEAPERWQSPLRTIVWGIGDCDDLAVLIACSLRSFRIPVRLKFLRMTLPAGLTIRDPGGNVRTLSQPRRMSHVYAQALLGGNWRTLEAVKPYALGFDSEDIAKSKGVPYTVEYIGDGG